MMMAGIFLMDVNTGLVVSAVGSTAIYKVTREPLPRKPKTRINIKGNKKLNMTADGLLKMARKLAFVIASMPVS